MARHHVSDPTRLREPGPVRSVVEGLGAVIVLAAMLGGAMAAVAWGLVTVAVGGLH